MSYRPGAKADAPSRPRGGPKELPPERREKTLFVGNLDKRITERHLIQLFSQFGELHRVQFMWHHHGELKGQPRGFAFVEFQEKECAALACAQANGVDLAGRALVIRFAEEKDPNEGLQVDYKSAGERRRGDVATRVSAYQGGDGGRGGTRGGRGGFGGSRGDRDFVPFDKYAYVPAPIPSTGFSVDATSGERSKDGVLLSALTKVRVIEDKLAAIREELAFERKRAGRAAVPLPSASQLAASEEREKARAAKAREAAWTQEANPNRRDYVHPSRRKASRSRSRSPQRQQEDRHRHRSRSRSRERR